LAYHPHIAAKRAISRSQEAAVILVVGATGQVGGEVCRLLAGQNESVRALVRSTSHPARLAALHDLGVELVEGDLRAPETLAAACADVSAIISTAGATAAQQEGDTIATVDRDGQLALIEAATAAAVEHMVFVSFSSGIRGDTPLHGAKRAVEQRLRESGISWTVLRPTAFMEVWLSPLVGFDATGDSVVVFGSGGAAISYISLYDVARFCVESLVRPAAWNRTIELGGPEPITPLQAVRIVQEVTGRTLRVTHVPADVLRAQYEGTADPARKTMAGLTWALTAGDAIDMGVTAQSFGFRLRTVRDFFEATYAQRRPEPAPPPA
jgi:uncharacterized protein YbjT (DUF2867 family)